MTEISHDVFYAQHIIHADMYVRYLKIDIICK